MRQVMEHLCKLGPYVKAITATKTPKRVRLIWTKEIKNHLREEKLVKDLELEEKEVCGTTLKVRGEQRQLFPHAM